MKIFKNAADAWWFVSDHPKMNGDGNIPVWIEITPHLVNPKTMRINKRAAKNTLVEWWVECGPSYLDDDGVWQGAHDYKLDCGDVSADKAVIKLAELVLERYGDY